MSRPLGVHRLGRGLGSLIPSRSPRAQSESGVGDVQKISIGKINANPRQPRSDMRQDDLEELAHSIREHGILQPLVVSPSKDGFELIAGERRFRAAQMVGLATVPVVVRTASEQEKLLLALVENLQRQDLNPMESANAFRQLMTDFNLTQEAVAARVGKSRSYVANTLRLLTLPAEAQRAIVDRKLTEGHAKVLLSIKDPTAQRALFERMLREGLSVRKGEAFAASPRSRAAGRQRDANLAAKEQILSHALGTKVTIAGSAGRGEIRIAYFSNEELNALLESLTSSV